MEQILDIRGKGLITEGDLSGFSYLRVTFNLLDRVDFSRPVDYRPPPHGPTTHNCREYDEMLQRVDRVARARTPSMRGAPFLVKQEQGWSDIQTPGDPGLMNSAFLGESDDDSVPWDTEPQRDNRCRSQAHDYEKGHTGNVKGEWYPPSQNSNTGYQQQGYGGPSQPGANLDESQGFSPAPYHQDGGDQNSWRLGETPRTTTLPSKRDSETPWKVDIERVEDKIDKMQSDLLSELKKIVIPAPAPSQPVGRNQSPARMECYSCGSQNHFKRDCPKFRRSPSRSPSPWSQANCFHCDSPGHMKRDCPMRNREKAVTFADQVRAPSKEALNMNGAAREARASSQ
ncbi:CNBP [Mytilus coruscus]|uniref:CNBP n=1 Tax=Mytilus coruscus TaxID=42192 RepID=A0A6J8EBW2_MYTCO|nr:CNBP [Mytilus coruscus]